jgi:three-Cys-motif partner protein
MLLPDSELFKDDGLLLPEVGIWAVTKHKKIEYYSHLFASSMKKKWQCRIYIDLFAGAGKARIEGSKKIIPGSPLLALNIDYPFDRYLFCDKDPKNIEALNKRVKSYFPDRDCTFIVGDSNDHVEDIIKAIPRFTKSLRGLSFCLVDPFKAADIRFQTIKEISEHIYVDFLILIPSYMDINRNRVNYLKTRNISLDAYLGTYRWRDSWKQMHSKKKDFGLFVTEVFCFQMKSLGYIYESLSDLELIRMEIRQNLPLYHLAFFSKSELGLKFWRTTRKRTTNQLSFW